MSEEFDKNLLWSHCGHCGGVRNSLNCYRVCIKCFHPSNGSKQLWLRSNALISKLHQRRLINKVVTMLLPTIRNKKRKTLIKMMAS